MWSRPGPPPRRACWRGGRAGGVCSPPTHTPPPPRAGRLAGGLVVAPDHVAPRAGVDRVAAVAAEQLVVAVAERHDAPVPPADADEPAGALAALGDPGRTRSAG